VIGSFDSFEGSRQISSREFEKTPSMRFYRDCLRDGIGFTDNWKEKRKMHGRDLEMSRTRKPNDGAREDVFLRVFTCFPFFTFHERANDAQESEDGFSYDCCSGKTVHLARASDDSTYTL
jgi:hypothetical protein